MHRQGCLYGGERLHVRGANSLALAVSVSQCPTFCEKLRGQMDGGGHVAEGGIGERAQINCCGERRHSGLAPRFEGNGRAVSIAERYE